MGKKYFAICILAILLPCAIWLSGCGCSEDPKVTGFNVYIGDSLVTDENNTITITYGDDIDWDNLLSVKRNFSDGVQEAISEGQNGYKVNGLPEVINANLEGYALTLTYGDFDAVKIKLVVNRATIDLSSVDWNYTSAFTYDGTQKSVLLSNLPNSVSANYKNNTYTNAGTYTASATIIYDNVNYQIANYNVQDLEWTINKGTPSYTVPTNLTAEVGDRLSSVTLPQGFAWNNPDDLVGEAGERTHLATYTPSDVNNYNIINNVSIVLNVQKATPEFAPVGVLNAEYGQTLADISLPTAENGTFVWEQASTTPVGNVGANTFVVIFTPYDLDSYKTVNVNVTVQVAPKSITKPTLSGSYTYTGFEQTAVLANFDAQIMSVSGNKQTNANTSGYTIVVALLDKQNYVWDDSTTTDINIYWIIAKAQFDFANVSWNYSQAFTYDGDAKTVLLQNLPNGVTANYVDNVKTNVGNYTATVTFTYDSINCEIINNTVQNLSWAINKATNSIQGTLSIEDWTFGDEPNAPTGITALGQIIYQYKAQNGEYDTTVPTNAGTYFVKGVVEGNENYESAESNEVQFEIFIREIAVPTYESETFIYDNTAKSPNLQVDETYVSLSGDTQKTEVGNYTLILSIKDTVNCKWAGDNQEDKTYNWYIIESPITSITLDSQNLEISDFNALTELEFNSVLEINVNEGFTVFIDNVEQNQITFNYNDVSHTITIKQNDATVFTKIISVKTDVDPVEQVIVDGNEYTWAEFVANPNVAYGASISVELKQKFVDDFYVINQDFTIIQNETIYIYNAHNNQVVAQVEVICVYDEYLINIALNNTPMTFSQLLSLNAVEYGATLSFTVNTQYADSIRIMVYDNFDENRITGNYSYTFDSVDGHLTLSFIDEQTDMSVLEQLQIKTKTIEKIIVNGKEFDIVENNYHTYNKDYGENSFTFSIDESYLSKYRISYYTSVLSNYVELTQSTLTLQANELGNSFYLHIWDGKTQVFTYILQIQFMEFCPVEYVNVSTINANSPSETENGLFNDVVSFSVNGFIVGLEITYTEGYQGCTNKVFNALNQEITDFTIAQNATYLVKIYNGNNEIYAFEMHIQYALPFIDEVIHLGDGDIPVLLTNNGTLSKNFEDTEFVTNQSITFDSQQLLNLSAGLNDVNVSYTAQIDGVTYTYSTTMFVDFIIEDITQYVDNIQICVSRINQTLQFSDDFRYCPYGEFDAYALVLVEADDITITTKAGVTVISKQIVFANNYTLCYLEYTLSTSDGNKTFRAHIDTMGSISNSTDATFTYSDSTTTDIDITAELQDDYWQVEALMTAYFYVEIEDYNAKISVYNGAYLIRESYGNTSFSVDETGTYTIRIVASDNKTTREITIDISIDNTVLEVGYNDKSVSLWVQSNGLMGGDNLIIEMFQEELTINIYSYIGAKAQDDENTVIVNINTMYADYLFYHDKTTPITNTQNLELQVFVDDDGSITKVQNAEYAVVWVIMPEQQGSLAFYIIFVDFPELDYPMSFTFDSNNNSQVDADDFTCSIQLNPNNIFDFGDFEMASGVGISGACIEVTRAQLGMMAEDTEVQVTINWAQFYSDYSYMLCKTPPQNIEDFVGPTEGSLTTTITLTFVDNIATIYVMAETATQENMNELLAPVNFVLID